MSDWDYSIAEIGDQLPPLTLRPINQDDLVLYANASGDQNPIHINQNFAKKSGLPNVIAHGMLIMSYLGRLLTNFIPQSSIKNFTVQFFFKKIFIFSKNITFNILTVFRV